MNRWQIHVNLNKYTEICPQSKGIQILPQEKRAKRIQIQIVNLAQIQIVNLAQIQNVNTVQIRGLNVAAGIRNSQFRELFTFQQKD